MTDDLPSTIASFTDLVTQENALLGDSLHAPVPAELVAAKLRLAGMVEARALRIEAGREPLPEADRAALADDLAAMRAALDSNAALLKRRIALCDDLMGAISREARRLSGGRTSSYAACGKLSHADLAVPIAVNTSL